MGKPEVYMLCGPAGSGKTTYAERLIESGAVKLSLDESMAERHGRAGVDYPITHYPALEQGVLADHRRRLIGMLATGTSVVLDYGFGRREQRAEYKELISEHGGKWRLLYFDTPMDVLQQRLAVRNERDDANALPVTQADIIDFVSWFEVPDGEGEEVISVGEIT
jgi:predicted kinase